MEKYVNGIDEEIKKEEYENKRKKHNIDVLKREHEELTNVFGIEKEDKFKQIKDKERKLYHEQPLECFGWRLEKDRGKERTRVG